MTKLHGEDDGEVVIVRSVCIWVGSNDLWYTAHANKGSILECQPIRGFCGQFRRGAGTAVATVSQNCAEPMNPRDDSNNQRQSELALLKLRGSLEGCSSRENVLFLNLDRIGCEISEIMIYPCSVAFMLCSNACCCDTVSQLVTDYSLKID